MNKLKKLFLGLIASLAIFISPAIPLRCCFYVKHYGGEYVVLHKASGDIPMSEGVEYGVENGDTVTLSNIAPVGQAQFVGVVLCGGVLAQGSTGGCFGDECTQQVLPQGCNGFTLNLGTYCDQPTEENAGARVWIDILSEWCFGFE